MSFRASRRPAYGLVLSVLAHVAVIAWLAHLAPSVPLHEAPSSPMQVTLLRLVPAPPRAATPALPPAPRHEAARPARTVKTATTARHTPTVVLRQAAEAPPAAMPAPGDEAASADSAPTQAATSFDMQAARGAARTWVKGEGKGRGGADGQGTPFRPSRDEMLGRAIERARRPDCRNAYSGMGVLAAIPLAASAITGKGCKW